MILFVLFLCSSFVRLYGKAAYWDQPRRGANFFNAEPTEEWFKAARELGIDFARLVPDKWVGAGRDFLVGDADCFAGVVADDLTLLLKVLDDADRHNIRVVLSLLSLPGARWRQHNQNRPDTRLWRESGYRDQAIRYWRELASSLKHHPAIVGYNVLNEPWPERLLGITDVSEVDAARISELGGSLADLSLFYRDLVAAIREEDAETPIILDTGLSANPQLITFLQPIESSSILYSFHMYEPYEYTTRQLNRGRLVYPGVWSREDLESFFQPVHEWQAQHAIPASRILVGEFGCHRTSPGAKQYLGDLINLFERAGWHWAFYAFREDCWDGMDYEYGSVMDETERHENPLFDVVKQALRPTLVKHR